MLLKFYVFFLMDLMECTLGVPQHACIIITIGWIGTGVHTLMASCTHWELRSVPVPSSSNMPSLPEQQLGYTGELWTPKLQWFRQLTITLTCSSCPLKVCWGCSLAQAPAFKPKGISSRCLNCVVDINWSNADSKLALRTPISFSFHWSNKSANDSLLYGGRNLSSLYMCKKNEKYCMNNRNDSCTGMGHFSHILKCIKDNLIFS